MMLTVKLQKYQLYHMIKLINMNSYQSRVIEQATFTYSPSRKALENK